jgi:uncharacterized protein (TIGR02300 family)
MHPAKPRASARAVDLGQMTMGRPQLGTKCTCTACKERFYDLNRIPAICPKCGAEQPPEAPAVARRVPYASLESRRRAWRANAPVEADEAKEAEPEEVEDEIIDPDADDDTEIAVEPDHEKIQD